MDGSDGPPLATFTQPFAVISTTAGFRAAYDANGNMTLRVECSGEPPCSPITYTQEWDAENRLTVVTNTVSGQVTRFVYDGDGNRVLRMDSTGTRVYIGDYYEKQGATVTKYYYAGGQRIAVRAGGVVYWLHGDHLGSATLATDANGNRIGELRYTPYGVTRYEWGNIPTNRRYTGQPWEGVGLYDYGARYYSPGLGRFVSADVLVPNPGAPQSLNRYAYVQNSPLVYVDDDGRLPIIPLLIAGGLVVLKVVDYGWTAYDVYQSGRVLTDPDAARGEKLLAGLNIALAVAFEAGEPDDEIPVSVPLDDVGRLAVMAGARRALAEGGEEALERYLRDNLGDRADDVLEWMLREAREEGTEALSEHLYRFANNERLLDHFARHGSEFGYETAEQYVRGANSLISREGIKRFIRANGDTLFYDPVTNEFAVLSRNNIIRTYFKPIEGMDYWLRQIGGGH